MFLSGPSMEQTMVNSVDLLERVASYRRLDEARHRDLESLAHQLDQLQRSLDTVRTDLEDEQNTRRTWRKRAEEAESAMVSPLPPRFGNIRCRPRHLCLWPVSALKWRYSPSAAPSRFRRMC